jgi:hypothetical protein
VTQSKKYGIKFPAFCDFSCKYASFAGKELIGDCRKELAVYCKHFKKYNNKNNRCFGIKR